MLSAYSGGSLANFDFYAVQTYFSGDLLVNSSKKISTANSDTGNLYLTTSDTSKAIYTDRKIGIGTASPVRSMTMYGANPGFSVQDSQGTSNFFDVSVGSVFSGMIFKTGTMYCVYGASAPNFTGYPSVIGTTFMIDDRSGYSGFSFGLDPATKHPLSKVDINGGVAIGSYAGANAAPSNGMIVSGSVGIGNNSPSYTLDVTGKIRSTDQLVNTLADGTTPMLITSTTKVANLNVDRLDDYHAGNLTGQIPVSNGTMNVNLNSEMLGGLRSADYPLKDKNYSSAGINVIEQVAAYGESGSGITGTIKITLPKSWSNTMLEIEIDGYNFSTKGYYKILMGGYNYDVGPAWTNCTAVVLGDCPFTSIRFAHDGTKCCILLGVTSTPWDYPKLNVSRVVAGHLNNTGWSTGWTITRIASETGITVTSTVSDLRPIASNSDTLDTLHATSFMRSDADSSTSGKVTFTNTTWSNTDGSGCNFIIKNNSVAPAITLVPSGSVVTNGSMGWSLHAGSVGASIGDGNIGLWAHAASGYNAMFKVTRAGEGYLGVGANNKIWHDGNLTPGNYLLKSGGNITGNVTCDTGITIDGRDVGADGTKLDVLEATRSKRTRKGKVLTSSVVADTTYTIADLGMSGVAWDANSIVLTIVDGQVNAEDIDVNNKLDYVRSGTTSITFHYDIPVGSVMEVIVM
jgi:hypothetical protein